MGDDRDGGREKGVGGRTVGGTPTEAGETPALPGNGEFESYDLGKVAGGGGGFGGVEGKGQGPEAVGMAVAGAFAGETDVAGGGGFLADAAEVGADGGVVGSGGWFYLQRRRDRVGEFFFDGGSKMNSFDAVGAEFFLGALGELAADAV